jgi:hypothetical protein
MVSSEDSLNQAVTAYNSREFTSIRATAKAYNLPYATLYGRLKGASNAITSHASQQRLTPDQEDFLASWILEEDARGYPPSHARARDMAIRVLRMNGDHAPLGRKWITTFLRRNQRVASVVGKKIEASRVRNASVTEISAFFDLFQRTCERLNISLNNVWNMDETGIALGVCSNSQVLASARKKKAYKATPENREWVSIIEAISSDGRRLNPVIIFKGKSLQTSWFPSTTIPDWFYTTSENGWTSNHLGLKWLTSVFLPFTTTSPPSNRLLILDGHGSHIDLDFQIECKVHKVELLYLPPHTSHILQPLDLASFGSIKASYRSQIAQLSAIDDAAPVKKERFITCYKKARDFGLSSHIIKAGWRASGLVPFNPSKVLSSSQVIGRPITPPPQQQPQQLSTRLYRTPEGPKDISEVLRYFENSGTASREVRFLLGKMSKTLSAKNTRFAILESELVRLKLLVDGAQKLKRKAIRKDINEEFGRLHNIEEARNRSATKKATKKVKNTTSTTQKALSQALEPTVTLPYEICHTDFIVAGVSVEK